MSGVEVSTARVPRVLRFLLCVCLFSGGSARWKFPLWTFLEILCQLLPTVLAKNVEAWCGEKKHFTSYCESPSEDVNLYVTLT